MSNGGCIGEGGQARWREVNESTYPAITLSFLHSLTHLPGYSRRSKSQTSPAYRFSRLPGDRSISKSSSLPPDAPTLAPPRPSSPTPTWPDESWQTSRRTPSARHLYLPLHSVDAGPPNLPRRPRIWTKYRKSGMSVSTEKSELSLRA